MKKSEEAGWQKTFLIIIMLAISIPAVGVASYYYGKSFRDIFILVLSSTACFGTVVFSLIQSKIYNTLHYDNGGHFARFVVVFVMGAIICCLLPVLPDTGWAVPVLALALSLFSNTVTGLIAYAGLISVCTYLAGADILVFIVYFFVGVIFAALFEKLDDDYKTGKPLAIAMLIYVVCIVAKVVFQSHGTLMDDMLSIAVINVFITFMSMLAVLRFYCAVVIDKDKGNYLLINDQEFELLAKYKEEDKQIYYNAIHTAYFAEKTARLLHMDVDVAKNGGYYHRIIAIECQKQGKSLEEICREYKFPPKAVLLLQEYSYKSQHMKMRETVAVYLADCVVSSIMYLISKERSNEENAQKSEMDYGKLAIAVIRRKIESKILNDSDISLADLGGIEKIYTGEKLYYDFLRRE